MSVDQSSRTAATPPSETPPHTSAAPWSRFLHRPEFGALVGVIAVYIFFLITAAGSGFFSLNGTASWINTSAELGIVAIPIALLLISGEFDLSIGSTVGASSMIVAISSGVYTTPQWVAIALALGFALIVGFVNGFVTTRTRLPSFIVTLATQLLVGGAALGLSRAFGGTTAVSLDPDPSTKAVFGSRFGQLEVTFIWCLVITAIAWWVLTQTRFGNWIYAIGGSTPVAREAGVPVARVKITLFMSTSFAAALVGIIQTMAFNGGDVTRGRSFIFDGVIAAVIGGVLLAGGYGSALGVLLGVCTYGIVSLGIFYTGWDTDYAQLFLGALLLVAVVANNYFRKLALSKR